MHSGSFLSNYSRPSVLFGMESGCCEKRQAGKHYDCPGCEPLFPKQSNKGVPKTDTVTLTEKPNASNAEAKRKKDATPVKTGLLGSCWNWLKGLFTGFFKDLKRIFTGAKEDN